MILKHKISKTGRRKAQPSKERSSKWILQLYIAGQTARAVTALKNLRSICNEQLNCKYKIEVIDLLKNPKLGRENQILAIPTLMKKLPLPTRVIIGDLSNTQQVLWWLNFNGTH